MCAVQLCANNQNTCSAKQGQIISDNRKKQESITGCAAWLEKVPPSFQVEPVVEGGKLVPTARAPLVRAWWSGAEVVRVATPVGI